MLPLACIDRVVPTLATTQTPAPGERHTLETTSYSQSERRLALFCGHRRHTSADLYFLPEDRTIRFRPTLPRRGFSPSAARRCRTVAGRCLAWPYALLTCRSLGHRPLYPRPSCPNRYPRSFARHCIVVVSAGCCHRIFNPVGRPTMGTGDGTSSLSTTVCLTF